MNKGTCAYCGKILVNGFCTECDHYDQAESMYNKNNPINESNDINLFATCPKCDHLAFLTDNKKVVYQCSKCGHKFYE
jgi:ribosomal protein S27AE